MGGIFLFLAKLPGREIEAETALQIHSVLNKEENEEEGKEDIPQHTHTRLKKIPSALKTEIKFAQNSSGCKCFQ